MPARKTWRTWTVKEIRRLEELRLAGECAAQIARVLGRTYASVRCRIQQEGARRGSRLEKWLPLVTVPHSTVRVARFTGYSLKYVNKVKRVLRAQGFPCYRCPPTNQNTIHSRPDPEGVRE